MSIAPQAIYVPVASLDLFSERERPTKSEEPKQTLQSPEEKPLSKATMATERKKTKKGNIMDLNKYLDKAIKVKFTGGREGTSNGCLRLFGVYLKPAPFPYPLTPCIQQLWGF